MSGDERRNEILDILDKSQSAISGDKLAEIFEVSRQVIVQDIALLRANKNDIVSTNRGYILQGHKGISRIFKVVHTNEQIEEELNLIVDLGGRVQDEFVYHKVYGVVSAGLSVKNRRDVKKYLEMFGSGISTPLLNITGGYHYHTVVADDEETLDQIQQELSEKGFLAQLQNYEPVDFWKK